MLGWLKRQSWLKPAGLLLVGGVGGSAVAPIWQGAVTQYYADRQSASDKTEKAIRDFREAAMDFDHLVASFVIAISQDNKVNLEAKSRLLSNILNQKQLLEAAIPMLPAEVGPQVRAYETALRALNGTIPGIREVATMREFWERTSDLVVARSDLYAKLRSTGA
ncbi:hypothetical protein [Paracraurococcus lichenis]|uniref:Uncharacterized protein n=1 Tax=Paracraurococcus lichenis TaxID=3064888 RepID=A0ABT9E8J1_9PROT|nr:hypothetical protein [Paracraurococcus sp. LOR1-02]MDO9712471.1 hypothetical protein [Paracraurococcus sp. LOR1-02]